MTIEIDYSHGTRAEILKIIPNTQQLTHKNFIRKITFSREIWQATKILVLENFRLYGISFLHSVSSIVNHLYHEYGRPQKVFVVQQLATYTIIVMKTWKIDQKFVSYCNS